MVDPFCGTGGIAIEAALQNIRALASDLDSRMVEGTKENLKWLGKECVVKKNGMHLTSRHCGEK